MKRKRKGKVQRIQIYPHGFVHGGEARPPRDSELAAFPERPSGDPSLQLPEPAGKKKKNNKKKKNGKRKK
jgi:hypothetical protein